MRKKLGSSEVVYDPGTGEFRWIVCCKKPWLEGELATRPMSNGYLYIKAGGKRHSASRLAYELAFGQEVPHDLEIDHINRNNQDNRPGNLRIVDRKGNLANSIKPLGVSGHRGIRAYNRPSGNGRLWRMKTPEGLKYFQTLEDAVKARLANGC